MSAKNLLIVVAVFSLLAGAGEGCRRIKVPLPPEKVTKTTETKKKPTSTSKPALQYEKYTIKRGDTLGRIVNHFKKKYYISVESIENHNPGLDERNLTVGRVILIPIRPRKPAAPPA